MSNRRVFSVSQVNRYAKRLLETDAILAGVFIEGEMSNFNAHTSGHFYFSLKDNACALSAVMFFSHTHDINFKPKNGMKVIAFGRLSLYEKTGQYQLYVEFLEPAGVGAKHVAFTQLCEKLKAEGLFESSRKRAIPQDAQCIALITSPTGAVVRDMIKIAKARNPAVKLVVVPTMVQGENAPAYIARAIREVNEWGGADTIILGRGGGSLEDLWAFNEEITARAVVASRIPIISAIGHETDTVITDFVADLRAPTPSAAAQIAVHDAMQQVNILKNIMADLLYVMRENMKQHHIQVKNALSQMSRLMQMQLANERQTLIHREALLAKLSPYAAFKRGFAFVQTENKQAVTDISDIKENDWLRLFWANGTVKVQVCEVKQTV